MKPFLSVMKSLVGLPLRADRGDPIGEPDRPTQRPADRLTLVEGHHYQHFPSPDGSRKALAIFYSPIAVDAPILPYYNKTKDLPCGRLLINPFTADFYQDCLQSVEEVVARIGAAYDETIHYGYSMGAYAAMRFGSTDPKARLIVAMSPHFVLDRQGGRCAKLMTGTPSPADIDVRPYLERATGKTVVVVMSCLDVDDGLQVEDSLAISVPWVMKHYALDHHYLGMVNNPNNVVTNYLKNGTIPSLDPEYVANHIDIADSIAAFHKMKAFKEGRETDDSGARVDSRIPPYSYWIGMQALKRGSSWDALQWFLRAMKANARWNLYVPEYATALGKLLAELGYDEPALGFFRHFHSHERAADDAYLGEAATLLKLGRIDEMRVLADYYELKHGTFPIPSEIRAMTCTDDGRPTTIGAAEPSTGMTTLKTALSKLNNAAAFTGQDDAARQPAHVERHLVEGQHYVLRRDPGGGKQVLAIFYANAHETELEKFRNSEKIDYDRLYINPLSNDYYQDCRASILRLLGEVGADYERTLHIGLSMGGYAALRFGSTDPKAMAIFALSPPLVLDRPYGRSKTLMQAPPLPSENDVRPFLVACQGKRIVIALSCLDTEDGATLADAVGLAAAHIEIHRVLQGHGLPALADAALLATAALSAGPLTLDRDLVASDQDVRDCIQAADIMRHIRDDSRFNPTETNVRSRIPQYHYWMARHCARSRRPWDAIAWYARALKEGAAWGVSRPDVVISMANVFVEVGYAEAALGFYRHLQDAHPPVATAFHCEANLSRRLGRTDEVRVLAEIYERRFGGGDGVAGRLRESVAGLG